MDAPWTPVELEPPGGWPPVADAVPVVVAEWERLPAGEARPHLAGARGRAVSVKYDLGVERARRFAEAWRWLAAVRRHGGVRPGQSEFVRRLAGAGVLRPVRRRYPLARGVAGPPAWRMAGWPGIPGIPSMLSILGIRSSAPAAAMSFATRWWGPAALVGCVAAMAWTRALRRRESP